MLTCALASSRCHGEWKDCTSWPEYDHQQRRRCVDGDELARACEALAEREGNWVYHDSRLLPALHAKRSMMQSFRDAIVYLSTANWLRELPRDCRGAA